MVCHTHIPVMLSVCETSIIRCIGRADLSLQACVEEFCVFRCLRSFSFAQDDRCAMVCHTHSCHIVRMRNISNSMLWAGRPRPYRLVWRSLVFPVVLDPSLLLRIKRCLVASHGFILQRRPMAYIMHRHRNSPVRATFCNVVRIFIMSPSYWFSV